MSFSRHARSIGPMSALTSRPAGPRCRLPLVGPGQAYRGATEVTPLLIVRDESHRLFLGGLLSSRARLRFTGCVHFVMKESGRSRNFQRTAKCGLTGCLSQGVHPIFTQEFRATLQGAVHDPSQAVVGGAEVVLRDVDTAVERRTMSGPSGQYLPVPSPRQILADNPRGGFQNRRSRWHSTRPRRQCSIRHRAFRGPGGRDGYRGE
jgi:hypothetical protein